MKRAAALAAIALALTGCAPSIKAGTVTGKTYQAAYTDSWPMCMPVGNNACGMMIWQTTHYPECWGLDLKEGEETGSVCVGSESIWLRYKVGYHYPDAQ